MTRFYSMQKFIDCEYLITNNLNTTTTKKLIIYMFQRDNKINKYIQNFNANT